ncbi:MAG: PAS domain S-box protein [Candidatus Hodarchaeota archaeon]
MNIVEEVKNLISDNNLEDVRKKLDFLYNNFPFGLVNTTLEGKIIFFNTAFQELLGYEKHELNDLNFDDLALERWKGLLRKVIKEEVLINGHSHPFEEEYIQKDGTIIPVIVELWLERDNEGNPSSCWGVVQCIQEMKELERINQIQRELAASACATSNQDLIFWACLDAALKSPDIDSGGIYIISPRGSLELAYSVGLSQEFIDEKSYFPADSPNAQLILKGDAIFTKYEKLKLDNLILKEGIKAIAISPIKHEGRVIACLNVASHVTENFSDMTRKALELITAQIGSAVARSIMDGTLRERVERYHLLFEQSNDAIFIHDGNGKILDVNEKACEMMGYSKKKLRNYNISDLHPESELETSFQALEVCLSDGNVRFESKFRRCDGNSIDVEISARVIDEKEQLIQGIVRDVTERKLAEQMLRESEEKYRCMTDLLPDIIFEADRNLILTYVNSVAFDKFGYSREDFKDGLNVGQFIVPEYKEKAFSNIKQILEGKVIPPSEYLLRRKDGTTFYARINSRPIKKNEEIVGFRGTITDINENKMMEIALRKSEARMRTAIESLPFDVYAMDENGYYSLQNTTCMKNWGNIIGKRPEEVVKDKKTLEIFMENNRQAYSGDIVSGEEIIDLDGEKRYIFNIVSPIHDGESIQGIMGVNIDITSMKNAERARKGYEDKLKYLVSSSPTIIYTSKTSGDYATTFISENVKTITGHDPTRFIDDSEFWLKNVHPMDHKNVWKNLEILNDKGKVSYEYRFKFKDGSYHWMRDEARIEKDDDGAPIEIIGSWSDITKQKNAEERVRYQANLVESVSDAIISTDIDFNIISWNKAAEQIYGWEAEKIIGKKIKDIIPIETFKDDPGTIIEKFLNKGLWKGVVTQMNIKGRIVYFLSSISLVRDKLGNPRGFVTINKDITENIESERKLKESEQKYRNLIENSPNYIFLLDSHGFIIQCNKKVSEILKLPLDEIIGMSIIELIDELRGTEPFYYEEFEKLIHLEEVFYYPYKIRKEDGEEMWLECLFSPVKIEGERYIQVAAHDITEQKNAEALIMEEIKKLKELDNIRNNFVYRASHELKTPLNSITGAVRLLIDYYKEKIPDKGKILLDIIEQGGIRLSSLIEDLIDTFRFDVDNFQLRLKKEDVVQIIVEVGGKFAYQLESRSLKLSFDLPKKLHVKLDKKRFEQVISNLITNAIKNTPPGGEINVRARKENAGVEISIDDTGVGLTNEEISQLFKKFGKIERYGDGMNVITEGSGLGLYIVKHIVDRHSGKIWVESEGRNRGSRFVIRL